MRGGLTTRALAESALGSNDQAVADMEAVIRAEPTDAGPYAILGKVYADAGDEEKANSVLDKAIALDPGNGEIYSTRARSTCFVTTF